ncbi:MAG: FMN-binding negative transcriptional regulator [Pirellulales bacterium]
MSRKEHLGEPEMYVPPAFAVTDDETLRRFIAEYGFGLLVSQHDDAPFATHLPMLLRPDEGPRGTIVGHVARANPQWTQLAGRTALAIFTGPHHYVSPTWYETPNLVPTWNYAAVHVYGRIETIDDEAALLDLLHDVVDTYEQAQPRPWTFENDDTFIRRMLGQIVGFRLTIERIEGKFKLNQNHPPAPRKGGRRLGATRRRKRGGSRGVDAGDARSFAITRRIRPLVGTSSSWDS